MRHAITFFYLLLFLNTATVFAGSADLSWSPNTEPDLAGYKVYYGTSSGNYGIPIDIGKQTGYTVPGLDLGLHYFAVTAYDSSGNESGFSNESSKTILVSDVTAPGAIPMGESSQFSNEGGGVGGGCGGSGFIYQGKGKPPGPEDSAEMIAMISIILLILLRKRLNNPDRIMGLSAEPLVL